MKLFERERGAFFYYGGKSFMVEDIISEIAKFKSKYDVNCVVDVFGGAGNVILNIPPEWRVKRIWNDLDKRLYITMKVLTDERKRKKLIDKLEYTVTSRDLFEEAGTFQKNFQKEIKSGINSEINEDDELTIAYYFLVSSNMGFNGGNFGFSTKKGYKAEPIYGYTEFLKRWSEMRKHLVIENLDFEELIRRYDAKRTLFYLDPPYLKSGRKHYDLSFNEDDFTRLVSVLSEIKGIYLMNESSVDFEFVKSLFGEPYMTLQYTNLAENPKYTGGKKGKRFEGYWSNRRY